MKRLLITTSNRGKLLEIRALLQGLPAELVTPSDLKLNLQVVEDAPTYAENAAKKASAFSEMTGLICLADDSGLEVDALGGAPGLHSARYLARPGATDADRRAHLLENLRGKPRPWTARFRAAVAVAVPHRKLEWAEGDCRGQIIPEERGSGGFGYDPIFLVAGTDRTMAELDMAEKNLLSHRARAITRAMPILESLFGAVGPASTSTPFVSGH